MWDLQSKGLIYSLPKRHDDRILSVGVTAEGNHVFSVSSDRIVYVWRRQTGELEYTLGPIETDGDYDRIYHEEWPAAFVFDSRQVVCGSKSGRIYMWEDGKLSFSSTGHHNQITSIAFAPDGQSFASGSQDGALMVWNASTGERVFDSLTGHSDRINHIVFSPDGTRIASGSDGGAVRLCSSFTGIQEGNLLLGHTAPVRSVSFSPSGNYLVSGSVDTLLRVWNLAVGQSIAVFKGHTDVILSVAFSPDGTQIVSGSGDMTIRLWNAPETTTPQHRTTHGTLQGAARSETHGEPTFEWELATDGWVRDTKHQLLLWVPLDLRSVLLSQQNSGLISRQGCVKLNFSGAKIGDDWGQCYSALWNWRNDNHVRIKSFEISEKFMRNLPSVTTLADLRAAVKGTTTKIVKISGIITGDGGVVDVGSKTTVLGADSNSGLTGGGFRVKNGNNVIIRNLHLSKSPAPTDLIGLQNATNVWVDHNTFTSDLDHGKDYYDGQCDISHASDFVTVSWNVFTEHYKVSLVGHSDNNGAEDTGHLRVTY
ncbi:unnamed protein product, partial [Rhizoctonia solani]